MSYKILILLTIIPIYWSQHLNNIPITFQLSGLTNYIPDIGGVGIPGYTFTLGYNYKSWIGIYNVIQVYSLWKQHHQTILIH